MSDPHVTSDDAAILRAHDRRFANAQKSFDRASRICREHPNRWNIQAVTQAMLGLSDEYLAGLERKAGREPGSYPRLNEEIYPPQIRPPAVEAWEDGPCGAGMSDKTVAPPCAASRAPQMAAEAFGGICGGADGRGPKSIDLQTTPKRPYNPAPFSDCQDEHPPVPRPAVGKTPDEWAASKPGTLGTAVVTATLRTDERGITHGPDSPVAREFGRHVNPEDQGDGA